MSHRLFVSFLAFLGWKTAHAHVCGHLILISSAQRALNQGAVNTVFEHLDYCYLCRSHHRVSCYWCGGVIELGDQVRVYPQPYGYPSRSRDDVVFSAGEFGWDRESHLGCAKGICLDVRGNKVEEYKEGTLVALPATNYLPLTTSSRVARCGVRLKENPRIVHVPIKQPPRYF